MSDSDEPMTEIALALERFCDVIDYSEKYNRVTVRRGFENRAGRHVLKELGYAVKGIRNHSGDSVRVWFEKVDIQRETSLEVSENVVMRE